MLHFTYQCGDSLAEVYIFEENSFLVTVDNISNGAGDVQEDYPFDRVEDTTKITDDLKIPLLGLLLEGFGSLVVYEPKRSDGGFAL